MVSRIHWSLGVRVRLDGDFGRAEEEREVETLPNAGGRSIFGGCCKGCTVLCFVVEMEVGGGLAIGFDV